MNKEWTYIVTGCTMHPHSFAPCHRTSHLHPSKFPWHPASRAHTREEFSSAPPAKKRDRTRRVLIRILSETQEKMPIESG